MGGQVTRETTLVRSGGHVNQIAVTIYHSNASNAETDNCMNHLKCHRTPHINSRAHNNRQYRSEGDTGERSTVMKVKIVPEQCKTDVTAVLSC